MNLSAAINARSETFELKRRSPQGTVREVSRAGFFTKPQSEGLFFCASKTPVGFKSIKPGSDSTVAVNDIKFRVVGRIDIQNKDTIIDCEGVEFSVDQIVFRRTGNFTYGIGRSVTRRKGTRVAIP